MDRQEWFELLAEEERRLGFRDGFKMVFSPWNLLDRARIAFLSLKPGRPPDNADLRVVSDERGNSYEIERTVTKSPITEQFLKMAERLGVRPGAILSGVVAPFRGNRWEDLSPEQQQASLALGRRFWEQPLNRPGLTTIVAVSEEAAKLVADVTEARKVDEFSAGWGVQKIRVARTRKGATVIHLPHLSTFKLFSRPESEAPLARAFGDVWRSAGKA
jgi:hypothetical protein